MLGWLKSAGQGGDHPMVDPKNARALVESLSEQNPSQALEVLSDQLDSLRESLGIRAQRVYEIVDTIDTAGKPFQRKLSQEFVGSNLAKAQETRIAHVMGTFWLRLAGAYRMLVEMHESGDPTGAALRPLLSTIAARTIRAANLHLKWRLFRYSAVAPGFWFDLGRVYSVAEARGFAAGRVTVYPGVWGESTVQREMLKPLMLAVSSTDSLPAVQVEIVERVCAQFSELFVMQKQAATGCHFWFDIMADKSPARLADRLALAPSLRFFGPANAAYELEKLGASIKQTGAVPSSLNLGGDYSADQVLDVLNHLARYWAPQPPARREARSPSQERIDVVNGLKDVLAAVAGDMLDAEFDGRRVDTWAVSNESPNGFGALAPVARTDWLAIGTLLGVKYQDGAAWGVGIARRISNDVHNNRHVGIEMFARGVTTVRLLPLLPDGRVHPDDELGEDALLLPSAADNSLGKMEVTLVMRLGTFSPQKSYGMRMYAMDYLLVPRRLIEAGQDFDIAEYRVLQRT
ncbi:MAG: hypothetical protein KIT73_11530 [Burkholderiales bacterium]|nr:hypothetical protein [Burkholderiales bacterium]